MSGAVPRILLIDDDQYQLGLVSRYLGPEFSLTKSNSVANALALVAEASFDLVILDVMMPDDGAFPAMETHHGWETGIPLAAAIQQRRPGIRIIAWTASPSVEIHDWFSRDATVACLPKSASRRQLLRTVNRLLGRSRDNPQIFIVHGRERIVTELKDYLQNTLRLGEPIVLAEKPAHGKTLIEKFEHYSAGADLAFVLMTPDDEGALRGAEARQPRSRQNVIFELGYFLGYLKRGSGRVVIMHKGPLEMPSDLVGISCIDISLGIGAAGEEIRRELSEWL